MSGSTFNGIISKIVIYNKGRVNGGLTMGSQARNCMYLSKLYTWQQNGSCWSKYSSSSPSSPSQAVNTSLVSTIAWKIVCVNQQMKKLLLFSTYENNSYLKSLKISWLFMNDFLNLFEFCLLCTSIGFKRYCLKTVNISRKKLKLN